MIYIEWADAISDTPHWITKDDAIEWADNEDFVIKQAGYVLKETEEYILIAGQFNEQKGTDSRYSNLHKIPKTWIRKRIDLTNTIA